MHTGALGVIPGCASLVCDKCGPTVAGSLGEREHACAMTPTPHPTLPPPAVSFLAHALTPACDGDGVAQVGAARRVIVPDNVSNDKGCDAPATASDVRTPFRPLQEKLPHRCAPCTKVSDVGTWFGVWVWRGEGRGRGHLHCATRCTRQTNGMRGTPRRWHRWGHTHTPPL